MLRTDDPRVEAAALGLVLVAVDGDDPELAAWALEDRLWAPAMLNLLALTCERLRRVDDAAAWLADMRAAFQSAPGFEVGGPAAVDAVAAVRRGDVLGLREKLEAVPRADLAKALVGAVALAAAAMAGLSDHGRAELEALHRDAVEAAAELGDDDGI